MPPSEIRCDALIEHPQPASLLQRPPCGDGTSTGLIAVEPELRPHDEPAPPLLRGWFHLVALCASVPAGILVVVGAPSTRARTGAVVYALAVSALFAVSATYHLGVWSAGGRRRMRRLDHGTIYVMIAGCYTPLCLLALGGRTGVGVLVAAWVGAAIGLGLALAGLAEKPVFGLACYIALGWILLPALPGLVHQLGSAHFGLLLAGGVLYTVGGLVLGTNWPNPFPRVFGYHEIWHLLVVAACVCHYVTIYSVIH
ncbi:MAG: hemolysin III family protein [Actinomycetota bacterium]|nr:hemolysin III family protein [Actinomycetota bacterium]